MPQTVVNENPERIAPLASLADPIPDHIGKRRKRNHRRALVSSLIAVLGVIASIWFWPTAVFPALFMAGLAVGTSSYIGFSIKYSAGPRLGVITPYLPEVGGVWLGFTTTAVAVWETLKTLA